MMQASHVIGLLAVVPLCACATSAAPTGTLNQREMSRAYQDANVGLNQCVRNRSRAAAHALGDPGTEGAPTIVIQGGRQDSKRDVNAERKFARATAAARIVRDAQAACGEQGL